MHKRRGKMRKIVTGSIIWILLWMGCNGVDNEPPTVWISSPGNGDTVSSVVRINIQATDNKDVQSVEIYLNKDRIHTATAPPYFYDWVTDSIQQDTLSHTIYAKAYDAAENEGLSDTISVFVYNDSLCCKSR